MAERALVIVKTGSAEAAVRERRGDFEAWIEERTDFGAREIAVVDVGAGGALPEPSAVAGAVVTGSAAFVSEREPWSVRTGAWLARLVAASVPVLGICYGHQLLAQALGGRVGKNPRGREIGTVRVDVSAAQRIADPLLGGLPGTIDVQATHLESVLELPPGARLLGSNEADPHQACAYGSRAWGVQFHPEFDGDVMRGYLAARAELLRAEGLDADRLGREVRESPHGALVLRRFSEIVRAS